MNELNQHSHFMASGPKDGPEALAELARNAPTTMEEVQRRLSVEAEAKRRGPVAREGETHEQTLWRHAKEQREAKEAEQRIQIARQTASSVDRSLINQSFQSQPVRYTAVPALGDMIVKIGGGMEITYGQGRDMVHKGQLSEAEFVNAVLTEGRTFDPSFNMPRSTILGK
ncbi:hypothetical protein SD208_11365 [Ochrobactrum sp. BD67]